MLGRAVLVIIKYPCPYVKNLKAYSSWTLFANIKDKRLLHIITIQHSTDPQFKISHSIHSNH